jgi:hypothetical protein
MKNIEERIIELTRKEEQKTNIDLKNFDTFVKTLDEIYHREKPSYNIPLVDTIGKTYYNTFNRKAF